MLGRSLWASRKVRLITTVVVWLCCHTALLKAQEDNVFEAAVVRRVNTGYPPYPQLDITPGRLTARAACLKYLITEAYGVEEYQLSGISGWMETETYFISATAGQRVDRTRMMTMLRHLLAERFLLKAHHETREMPVFGLVIDKSGLKLPPLREALEGYSMRSTGADVVVTIGSSIQDLVRYLNVKRRMADIGRPTVDRTGLRGLYRIHLKYLKYTSEVNPDGRSGRLVINYHSGLVSQLGLKLEPMRTGVDTLVIDSAARPQSGEQ